MEAIVLVEAVPICITDLRERRIPDLWTIGGLLLAVLISAVFAPSGLPARLIGASVGFLPIRLLNLWTGGKIGLGDAKYSALIGAGLGVGGWFWALLAASLLGLVVGGVMMALGRMERHYRMPFGPFLAAGSLFSVLAAGPLSAAIWG